MGNVVPASMRPDAGPLSSGIVLEVCLSQGRVETPLEEWLRSGPGLYAAARPVAARLESSGRPLPLGCIVPLRYRNNQLSRLLIALRLLPDPWQLHR